MTKNYNFPQNYFSGKMSNLTIIPFYPVFCWYQNLSHSLICKFTPQNRMTKASEITTTLSFFHSYLIIRTTTTSFWTNPLHTITASLSSSRSTNPLPMSAPILAESGATNFPEPRNFWKRPVLSSTKIPFCLANL